MHRCITMCREHVPRASGAASMRSWPVRVHESACSHHVDPYDPYQCHQRQEVAVPSVHAETLARPGIELDPAAITCTIKQAESIIIATALSPLAVHVPGSWAICGKRLYGFKIDSSVWDGKLAHTDCCCTTHTRSNPAASYDTRWYLYNRNRLSWKDRL